MKTNNVSYFPFFFFLIFVYMDVVTAGAEIALSTLRYTLCNYKTYEWFLFGESTSYGNAKSQNVKLFREFVSECQ